MTTYKSIKYNFSGTDLTGIDAYNDNKLQSNVALLGFKTAVNGSLAKYNLQDQIIDEYEDATGIDASASTNEALSSGAYFGGSTPTVTQDADETGTDGDYTWYKWTDTAATGSYETDTTQDHEYLVVAGGGGGGGCDHGGGGGAGGLRTATGFSLIGGTTYTTTVGAGGAGGTNSPSLGSNGSNSSLSGSDITDVTSAGGGGGGGNKAADQIHGADGGSGGGGAGYGGAGDGSGGSGDTPDTTPDQGNDGGDGDYVSGSPYSTGGGGGAGAVGADASGSTPGNGGAGIASSIAGSSVFYAGGGGGSKYASGTQGSGGAGGGGAGQYQAVGTAGTANTGGGGGGSSGIQPGSNSTGGAGGSGVVILRRLTNATGSDLTLQSTDTTSLVSNPTSGDMVMLMENGSGTATLNTDIKGYISRDSGTTFTQGTLVDEGTWGTNKKIYAFHDLDISAQSGTSMCYKITTHNQSASKDTRIHATSIGWR